MKPTLAVDLVAGIADQVCRFSGIAQRFHAVLADFQRDHRAEFKNALIDQVGCLAQQRQPFLPGAPAPGGESRAGSGNRVSRILFISLLKNAQHPIGIDRAAIFKGRFGLAVLAADEHGMFLAQVRL